MRGCVGVMTGAEAGHHAGLDHVGPLFQEGILEGSKTNPLCKSDHGFLPLCTKGYQQPTKALEGGRGDQEQRRLLFKDMVPGLPRAWGHGGMFKMSATILVTLPPPLSVWSEGLPV